MTSTSKPAKPAAPEAKAAEPTACRGTRGSLQLIVEHQTSLRVHFNVAEGFISPVTYNFGDGSSHTPEDGRETAHTYAEAGLYSVQVTDADGSTGHGWVMPLVGVNAGPQPAPAPAPQMEKGGTASLVKVTGK